MNFIKIKIFFILLYCLCINTILAQTSVSEIGMQPKIANYTSFSPSPSPIINNELDLNTQESFKSHPEYGINPYNTQCSDCIELIDRRTDSSRYFIKNGSNGKNFFIQKGYNPLHFKDENNRWISVDARLKPHPTLPNTYHAPNQQMPTKFNSANGNTSIQIGTLNLNFNANLRVYHVENNVETSVYANINTANTTVGEDGAKINGAFPGINRISGFDRGAIKTNFEILSLPSLSTTTGWLGFEDEVVLPGGYNIVPDNSAILTPEGYWQGDLKLITVPGGVELARWNLIEIFDNSNTGLNSTNAAYDLKVVGNTFFIRTLVKMQWLTDMGRVFPITIDPLVAGTNTWTAGDIGFTPYAPGNGFCGSSTGFCLGGPLNVTFPGQATITNVLWSSRYIATNPTFMQHGGFRMVGPCGENPTLTNNWWSCNVANSGTCSGVNNVVANLATCIPPSCNPTVIPFYTKNIHCQNPVAGVCNTARLRFVNNFWIVTVQGLTVEQPPVPLSSSGNTFCSGFCTVLTATGSYGVPPYNYVWSPGGLSGQSVNVCPPANTTTNYTCTITDQCGLTATNVIGVTTMSATLPLPAVNVQMNPPSGSPCPVTVTACSDVGNNYGGGPENYQWTFPGGVVTGGGALSGSANGSTYGGAGSATFCAGGASYTIVYNSPGTYNLGVDMVKGSDCAANTTPITVNCFILPIELLEFNAHYNGTNVELNWATSSEMNSDYFEIERSVDGFNFTSIEKIKAAGNSNTLKKYSALDLNPGDYGQVYYKLKLYDIGHSDAKFTQTKMVNIVKGLSTKLKVQPNPAQHNLELFVPKSFSSNQLFIQVFDQNGKRVFNKLEENSIPGAALKINLEQFPNGRYIVRVVDEFGKSTENSFIKN